jgi:hypothetical protein
MNQEHDKTESPAIEHVIYGADTGIGQLVFNGIKHTPYLTLMSNKKIHVYFTPGELPIDSRTPESLKKRASLKIDPRISYRHNGNHTTFHGILITPEYKGGKFSQPAFDWLINYCDDINIHVKNTTLINKPTISLFMQKQAAKYGFSPNSNDAIAEIFPPEGTGEQTKIRWLYNILPPEERIRHIKEHTFYEVCGDDGYIPEKRLALNLGHHVVAMHTTFLRNQSID